MNRESNSGFTLIELIIVIVILGILAVAAAPRFLDLTDDADLAVMKTYAANFEKSVKDANLRWQMAGSPGRIQNLPGYSDETLDMSTNGWPIGLDKGNANDNIGRGNQGCRALWNYLLLDAPAAATNDSEDFQSYRHTGNRYCSFVYRARGDTAGRASAKVGVLYNSLTGDVRACGTLTETAC